MKIEVRLFGPQAQRAGGRSVHVEVPDARPTCVEVRRALAEAAPALADSLPGSWLAVNHEYAEESRVIASTDEVALIGMISGG